MSDNPATVVCVPHLTLSPRKELNMLEIAQSILQLLAKDYRNLYTFDTVLYTYERFRRRKLASAAIIAKRFASLIPRVELERPVTTLTDDVKQVRQITSGSVMTFRSLNPKVVSDAERQLEQQVLANCHCPAELRPQCYLLKWKHCLTERFYCHYRALGEPIPRVWASCKFVILM